MNGKISDLGWLYIERAGKMKVCGCPFSTPDESGPLSCGDWCPLFAEPEKQETTFPEGCHTTLLICNERELTFSTFTDERGVTA